MTHFKKQIYSWNSLNFLNGLQAFYYNIFIVIYVVSTKYIASIKKGISLLNILILRNILRIRKDSNFTCHNNEDKKMILREDNH